MLDEIVMIDSNVKKVKVTPQEKNLQQKVKKNNTTPISRKNIQKKKENTTPEPILNFLNKFNFKPKKVITNKQEIETKAAVNENTDQEIFLSKFKQIKNVFENEKEKKKSSKLRVNSKLKTFSKPSKPNVTKKEQTEPSVGGGEVPTMVESAQKKELPFFQ